MPEFIPNAGYPTELAKQALEAKYKPSSLPSYLGTLSEQLIGMGERKAQRQADIDLEEKKATHEDNVKRQEFIRNSVYVTPEMIKQEPKLASYANNRIPKDEYTKIVNAKSVKETLLDDETMNGLPKEIADRLEAFRGQTIPTSQLLNIAAKPFKEGKSMTTIDKTTQTTLGLPESLVGQEIESEKLAELSLKHQTIQQNRDKINILVKQYSNSPNPRERAFGAFLSQSLTSPLAQMGALDLDLLTQQFDTMWKIHEEALKNTAPPNQQGQTQQKSTPVGAKPKPGSNKPKGTIYPVGTIIQKGGKQAETNKEYTEEELTKNGYSVVPSTGTK